MPSEVSVHSAPPVMNMAAYTDCPQSALFSSASAPRDGFPVLRCATSLSLVYYAELTSHTDPLGNHNVRFRRACLNLQKPSLIASCRTLMGLVKTSVCPMFQSYSNFTYVETHPDIPSSSVHASASASQKPASSPASSTSPLPFNPSHLYSLIRRRAASPSGTRATSCNTASGSSSAPRRSRAHSRACSRSGSAS